MAGTAIPSGAAGAFPGFQNVFGAGPGIMRDPTGREDGGIVRGGGILDVEGALAASMRSAMGAGVGGGGGGGPVWHSFASEQAAHNDEASQVFFGSVIIKLPENVPPVLLRACPIQIDARRGPMLRTWTTIEFTGGMPEVTPELAPPPYPSFIEHRRSKAMRRYSYGLRATHDMLATERGRFLIKAEMVFALRKYRQHVAMEILTEIMAARNEYLSGLQEWESIAGTSVEGFYLRMTRIFGIGTEDGGIHYAFERVRRLMHLNGTAPTEAIAPPGARVAILDRQSTREAYRSGVARTDVILAVNEYMAEGLLCTDMNELPLVRAEIAKIMHLMIREVVLTGFTIVGLERFHKEYIERGSVIPRIARNPRITNMAMIEGQMAEIDLATAGLYCPLFNADGHLRNMNQFVEWINRFREGRDVRADGDLRRSLDTSYERPTPEITFANVQDTVSMEHRDTAKVPPSMWLMLMPQEDNRVTVEEAFTVIERLDEEGGPLPVHELTQGVVFKDDDGAISHEREGGLTGIQVMGHVHAAFMGIPGEPDDPLLWHARSTARYLLSSTGPNTPLPVIDSTAWGGITSGATYRGMDVGLKRAWARGMKFLKALYPRIGELDGAELIRLYNLAFGAAENVVTAIAAHAHAVDGHVRVVHANPPLMRRLVHAVGMAPGLERLAYVLAALEAPNVKTFARWANAGLTPLCATLLQRDKRHAMGSIVLVDTRETPDELGRTLPVGTTYMEEVHTATGRDALTKGVMMHSHWKIGTMIHNMARLGKLADILPYASLGGETTKLFKPYVVALGYGRRDGGGPDAFRPLAANEAMARNGDVHVMLVTPLANLRTTPRVRVLPWRGEYDRMMGGLAEPFDYGMVVLREMMLEGAAQAYYMSSTHMLAAEAIMYAEEGLTPGDQDAWLSLGSRAPLFAHRDAMIINNEPVPGTDPLMRKMHLARIGAFRYVSGTLSDIPVVGDSPIAVPTIV